MNTELCDFDEILRENKRRMQLLGHGVYDPVAGDPADPDRVMVSVPVSGVGVVNVPKTMKADPDWKSMATSRDFEILRIRHDFEFWAAKCVRIRLKGQGRTGPLILNAPQRRVVRMLEKDRREGRPIRMVMLKARQWGGSTLVQMYFAWIQIVHRRNWNSLICAHVKDVAADLRGSIHNMLADYPERLWTDSEPPRFRSWQGAGNTREIAGRRCNVTITSSLGQDATRGMDFSLAHLSEVAYWQTSPKHSPADIIRNISGGIPMLPYTAIVMESTANGVGNFFHSQWMLAETGRSAYRPVFVPWYEIEIYRTPCRDPMQLWQSLTPYERMLWDKGLTLDMIQWYHDKRLEMYSDSAMQSEYPTDPVEAFVNSGAAVFESEHIEALRESCTDPLSALKLSVCPHTAGLMATPGPDGELKVWSPPDWDSPHITDRYVVAVDIGGRSRSSDYSVITVFDRMPGGAEGKTEIAAQWRGHADHDLIARYAARVGNAYRRALLVIESNTLESDYNGASDYILEELNESYRNVYVRARRDSATGVAMESRVGFHTNRATKSLIISHLVGLVRDGAYVERDSDACDELATYEFRANGAYAARDGHHDDRLMTRAIGLYVIHTLPKPHVCAPSEFISPLRASGDTIFGGLCR